MIHLLGVYHELQFAQDPSTSEERNQLSKVIIDEIKDKNITLIMEEASEDALVFRSASSTIPQQAQAKLRTEGVSVNYAFCDPNREARSILGIRDRSTVGKELGLADSHGMIQVSQEEYEKRVNEEMEADDRKREKAWLECLESRPEAEVLFICGYAHVEPFRELLISQGHRVRILPVFKENA